MTNINLGALTAAQGFRIDGAGAGDVAGISVSSAGDVNGDGLDDLLVGAAGANGFAGAAYVVYGRAGGLAGPVSLGALDPAQGFRLDGAGYDNNAGWSVSSAGDVNGDGLDDLIVGAPGANVSGAAYVVYGVATPQTWTGTAAAETYFGGAAADVLNGAGGNDSLRGNADDDTLLGGTGDDSLNGGSGEDRLDGGRGNDYLLGGSDDDLLDGGKGDDLLDGGTGADILIGGAGNDGYVVDDAGDIIVERADGGTDGVSATISWTLGANLENLVLDGEAAINGTGNAVDNLIIGNAGRNRLSGLAGDDLLDGGAGADWLRGGTGGDTFRFSNAPASTGPADLVQDFSLEQGDRVEIARGLLGGSKLPVAGPVQLSSLTGLFESNFEGVATSGSTRLVYEADRGRLLLDTDGNGNGRAVVLAVFSGAPGLEADDIWLI